LLASRRRPVLPAQASGPRQRHPKAPPGRSPDPPAWRPPFRAAGGPERGGRGSLDHWCSAGQAQPVDDRKTRVTSWPA